MGSASEVRARDGSAVSMDNHWMPFTANRAFQDNPQLFAG